MAHEQPDASNPFPEQVSRFQQLYTEALQAVPETGREPSDDDLTRLREQLLNRPAHESQALSEVRQEILDDPEKLRSFFSVFSRHDAALRQLEADGSLTLPDDF